MNSLIFENESFWRPRRLILEAEARELGGKCFNFWAHAVKWKSNLAYSSLMAGIIPHNEASREMGCSVPQKELNKSLNSFAHGIVLNSVSYLLLLFYSVEIKVSRINE